MAIDDRLYEIYIDYMSITCPKCNEERIVITDVSFAREHEVVIKSLCGSCKKESKFFIRVKLVE